MKRRHEEWVRKLTASASTKRDPPWISRRKDDAMHVSRHERPRARHALEVHLFGPISPAFIQKSHTNCDHKKELVRMFR